MAELKSGLGFLIFVARLVTTKEKQIFIEIPILHHFDLECYISVKT